jgi:DNA repair exonuclease SbcCD ATPase subunit
MDNCKVQLEKMHPDMFTVFKLNPPKLLTDKKENHRRKNEKYRHKKKDAFNLLREWVPGTKHLSYPQLLKKTANYIQELLNPDFIPGPQEKLPGAHKKDIKDYREYINIKMKEYRKEEISGFNLLRKWVPGTATLSRPEILKKTVKYIQELEQRLPVKKRGIQELEQRLPVKKRVIKELDHRIKELENSQTALSHRSFTQENYIKELEQKIKELETWQTPPREPHPSETVKTFAITVATDFSSC